MLGMGANMEPNGAPRHCACCRKELGEAEAELDFCLDSLILLEED